jgi:hypothetical protein
MKFYETGECRVQYPTGAYSSLAPFLTKGSVEVAIQAQEERVLQGGYLEMSLTLATVLSNGPAWSYTSHPR